MRHRTAAWAAGFGLGLAGLAGLAAGTGAASATPDRHAATKHVLLLSVDGLHQSDLTWYVTTHPHSALAALSADGTQYTRAETTFPSDSFPGMVAQLTGGGAGTTGVYYDDTYNRTLLAPRTLDCAAARPGTEVGWTEAADRSQDPITLDAGQGLSDAALTNLPTNSLAQTLSDSHAITRAIAKMTPTPQSLLDPGALPTDPASCTPLYPHQYLRVNTVLQVVHAAGLRTAWSDKHPAYEILGGASGDGIDDLFTPEINSAADNAGDDWTKDNALTREYDAFKVAAVLREIGGKDHSGARTVGVPAVFGMNFQSVSTAQKLPTSDGLTGGYNPDGTPGPLLRRALDFVDRQIGRMHDEIAAHGLAGTTTIILSAKHGQSPRNKALLRRVDDGAIIDAIDAGWAKVHPAARPLVVFAVDDDAMLLWLADRSQAALTYVKDYLQSHPAPANTISDPLGTYSTSVPSSGLTAVFTGDKADARLHAPAGDPRAPDVLGIARHGVVYTGSVKKISEHGGAAADDRDVPLVVSGAGVPRGAVDSTPVRTTQIAPTILAMLGFDPNALDAVRIEHTTVLPQH